MQSPSDYISPIDLETHAQLNASTYFDKLPSLRFYEKVFPVSINQDTKQQSSIQNQTEENQNIAIQQLPKISQKQQTRHQSLKVTSKRAFADIGIKKNIDIQQVQIKGNKVNKSRFIV
ncbi:Hypothetical_protein [Hexamita inflata]|uniref:Hypothetical_protein n=1 Tax=Hexamita inflata TaxID=28002 RepID=A0AA86Q7A1_9EUKA|nr:Hypothetical protein HINF_LOCUS41270 [Hexamita inflata]